MKAFLSIFDNIYVYNHMHEKFSNEIFNIFILNTSLNIHHFIPKYKTSLIWAKVRDEINLVWKCHLCERFIHEEIFTMCFQNDTGICYYNFHVPCIYVLKNIMDDKPIATLKTNLYDIIKTIPIYGCINNVIFTYTGEATITTWLLESKLYTFSENIYDSLTNINVNCHSLINYQCDICKYSDIPTYIINNKNYCVNCAQDISNFKDDLANKYLVIRQMFLTDICNIITCNIIDIYGYVHAKDNYYI